MSEDVDGIMNIYKTKSAGKYIPSVEQEFLEKCQTQKSSVVDMYLPKKGGQQQQVVENIQKPQNPSQPSQPQLLTEAQQRNNLLNEAVINLQKVVPLFSNKADREYLKEIREAIEELMG